MDAERRWKSLTALGNVLRAQEKFGQALDMHMEALANAMARDSAWHIAMGWNNIGGIFFTASEWDLAIECFARITENRRLVKVWSPYYAHGSLALCYLHLNQIRQGVESVRQALRLESQEIVARNPYGYVAFRLTFVQLALQGNRIGIAEINMRATEAYEFARLHQNDAHILLLSELIVANIEFAYGDHEAALQHMESLRIRAHAIPQLMNDVLFSLVQAEKLKGRIDRVRDHLHEWSTHLYPEGAEYAEAKLQIRGSLPTGTFLNDHLSELGLERDILSPLPAKLLALMKGPLHETA